MNLEKIIIVFLVVGIVVLVLGNPEQEYKLKEKNEMLEMNISDLAYEMAWYEYNITILERDYIELKKNNTELSNTVINLNKNSEALEKNIKNLKNSLELYNSTFGYVTSGENPRYSIDVYGDTANLINNETAINPTYSLLKDFLTTDLTDINEYDYISYPCGKFAEDLHNNAEKYGIKTAFVALHFEGGGEGHALNLFKTTDYGLIYIDDTNKERTKCRLDEDGTIRCTGRTMICDYDEGGDFKCSYEDENEPNGTDKVCFVKNGGEYVCLNLCECYPNCSYSRYTYENKKLEHYNSLVEQFNSEVSEMTEQEYDRRAEELTNIENDLITIYEGSGKISLIEIYW